MAKFNIKMIPMIKGYPNYEGINKIMHILDDNADNLPRPQGGV